MHALGYICTHLPSRCGPAIRVSVLSTMSALDHKIPPPVIALLCLLFAWAVARATPGFAYALPVRGPIAVVLALAGLSLALAGVFAFRKAKTTLNPHTPEQSTAIVLSGPYRFTRNPMYLGLALILLGVCVYLSNPLTLLAVVVFVAYLTRFQIIPEERVLLQSFGDAYARYTRSVRRWL